MEPSEPSPLRAKGYKLEQNSLTYFCNMLDIKTEFAYVKRNENLLEDIRQSYEQLNVKRGEFLDSIFKPFMIKKFAKVLHEKLHDDYMENKEYRYISGAYAYANDMGVDLFKQLLSTEDNAYARENKLGKWIDASINDDYSLEKTQELTE